MILNVIILAIIQGVTEFLPISSSGHLLILQEILNFQFTDSLAFDVALHLGTALAIILFFFVDLKKYFIAAWRLVRYPNFADEKQKTVVNIIIATIPVVLAGFFLENLIIDVARNLVVTAFALIFGGVLFLLVERYSRQHLDYQGLSLPEAFLIGLAQALALIPGVSRSGITIIAGMSLNLKRSEAARFSFLLSLPVVFGAGIKEMFEIKWLELALKEIFAFVLGIFVAALVGFVAIKFFIKFLQFRSLNWFAFYRIVLGVIILVWFLR